MDGRVYWIWTQLMFGVGTRRAELFGRYFNSPMDIWEQLVDGGPAAGMFTPAELKNGGPVMEQATVLLRRTLAKDCQVLTPDSADYPELLRHIYAKPAALYVKGDTGCLQALCIAMVGTRKHSSYGKKAAESLTGGLAENGVTIVSGLARGIDTICHETALAAGGKTVGILGCGLDIDYPAGSARLKTAMSENGAVISEYPLGIQPRPENFPIRNRVISGMSRGVVVVEADLHSGSLITANHALEQGRDVFAVPGGYSERGMQGNHKLIKEGAALADCAADILREYGLEARKKSEEPLYNTKGQGTTIEERPAQEHMPTVQPSAAPPGLSEDGAAVLEQLGARPVCVEELVYETELAMARLHTALTELELFGLVRSLPGRMFVRS